MARKPLDALALIGVGVRSVSVSSAAIGQIKAMVRSINIAELSEYMDYLLTLPAPSIRQWLADFASDHEIRV
jgi:phosphotransferase system enzyme I (PtsP)